MPATTSGVVSTRGGLARTAPPLGGRRRQRTRSTVERDEEGQAPGVKAMQRDGTGRPGRVEAAKRARKAWRR